MRVAVSCDPTARRESGAELRMTLPLAPTLWQLMKLLKDSGVMEAHGPAGALDQGLAATTLRNTLAVMAHACR